MGIVHLASFLSLAFFGVVLVWFAHALAREHQAVGGDLVSRLIALLGWMTMLATAVAFAVSFLGPIAYPLAAIVFVVAWMAAQKYRASEFRALGGFLALAAQRGVPLAEASQAFARERGFAYGVPASRLVQRLERGMPLDEALRQARIRLPVDAQTAVRVGCRTDTLVPLLRQSMTRPSEARVAITRCVEEFLLFFLLLHVAAVIVFFVMTTIQPTIEDLYAEYGIPLPTWTDSVLAGTQLLWPWLSLLYVVSLLILLVLLPYYVGWFRVPVPILRKLFLRSDSAVILNTLGPVIERGHSLETALHALSTDYPRWTVRRRLRKALRRMDQGREWTDALRGAGLLSRQETAVLRAAQRAGNLAWAMHELATVGMERLARRIRAISELLFPAVTLVAGLLVLAWGGGLLIAVFNLIDILADIR